MTQTVKVLGRTLTITNSILSEGWLPFGIGAGYWGRVDYADGNSGFIVTEHEPSGADESTHYVTWDEMRETFVKCIQNPDAADGNPLMGSEVHGYFITSVIEAEDGEPEWGIIDAEATDVWLQVACFGEVIYG